MYGFHLLFWPLLWLNIHFVLVELQQKNHHNLQISKSGFSTSSVCIKFAKIQKLV